MHRHKMPPSMGRNSIHMTPQADHRKTPAPSLGGGGTPSTGRHQLSSTGYREPGESHRRRNSQPTTPRSSQSGAKRDVVSPSSAAASSSSTINTSANQRVTEWLRSAGSLREEAEDDASPRRVPPDTRVGAGVCGPPLGIPLAENCLAATVCGVSVCVKISGIRESTEFMINSRG